jgi:hypothetical protein
MIPEILLLERSIFPIAVRRLWLWELGDAFVSSSGEDNRFMVLLLLTNLYVMKCFIVTGPLSS